MRIIVLYGTDSPERAVSIRSGIAVAGALIELGHEVSLVDPSQKYTKNAIYYKNKQELPLINDEIQKPLKGTCIKFNESLIGILKECDLVFPALHGGIGEDGTIQALLECFDIPFVGSSSKACALAMDKVKCKLLYDSVGICTPNFTVYKKGQSRPAVPPSYPCVVKPANAGSSIGLSFVYAPCGLQAAIDKALCVCDTVIMENRIFGTEVSISVLEDKSFAVTQILPNGTHYDYNAKYSKGGAKEITPAPLPRNLYNKLLNITTNAHNLINLHNFSRTDIIIESGTDRAYVLETNALPGMTETSILPSAAAACGITFCELVAKMLY